ncbi:MAG: amidohydrolase [Chloroflexi bacterium]|nr:amidohydrolase [Chloroflexota bacterium]
MLVDSHTHCFPPWLRERRDEFLHRDATFGTLYASPKAKMASADKLVAAMDEAGVDVAVAAGIGWTDIELARACNDYLAESAARFPHRLVGFAGVNPAWGEAAAREAERCARNGMRGLGELHPDTQGFSLADPAAMGPLMQVAEQHRLIVLAHASEPVGHLYPGKGHTTPDQVLALAQGFPRVTIVAAHFGGGLPFYALMPEVAAALANVYFDSAASPFLYQPRVYRVAADLVGADHLLFGTDFPLVPYRRALEQVGAAGLAPQERALVLGDNAARLLGLQ